MVAIGRAPVSGRAEQKVFDDKSCPRAIKKRRIMKSLGKLKTRLAGFDDDSAGVVLSSWVGVYRELREG